MSRLNIHLARKIEYTRLRSHSKVVLKLSLSIVRTSFYYFFFLLTLGIRASDWHRQSRWLRFIIVDHWMQIRVDKCLTNYYFYISGLSLSLCFFLIYFCYYFVLSNVYCVCVSFRETRKTPSCSEKVFGFLIHY